MTLPCQPVALLTQTAEKEPVRDGFGHSLLAVTHLETRAPFLVSVVADSDLWMYVSSNGGLTCGRRKSDRCLFPYETDDRLHLSGGLVGPFTLLRVNQTDGSSVVWNPFSPECTPGITRNLYKTELGHRVIFEEINTELGLVFRYQWANARDHGFVRTSELTALEGGPASASVEVLDGLLRIMPASVDLTTQQKSSALVNAYRHTELDLASKSVAMFQLSALIVDRAEPAESLACNAAYHLGAPDAKILLGPDRIETFRKGGAVTTETEIKGRPGNYLLAQSITLSAGEMAQWNIVADVALSQADVIQMRNFCRRSEAVSEIKEAILADEKALLARLASADALQRTDRRINDAHHQANVLFNCMRGGVYVDGYHAPGPDVAAFLKARNPAACERNAGFVDSLGERPDCLDLAERAERTQDADLTRLCLEYLPLTFSRRHGDPSRPWNAFDIRVHHVDGSDRLYYQGNWRDIFQNWEALSMSFPGFLPQIVAKFVNASTVDGFNPYRITKDGIDWEVPDPEDPWSNIGYWGDHQIVYLTRFLEMTEAFLPDRLADWLTRPIFSYAAVPYRLRPYADIVVNPRDTIDFDTAWQDEILARIDKYGNDGRLIMKDDGTVYHVTLAEKLLVPILSKLCNLVLDGGIWMNTQRPEWNDANNALAGFGLSMVTLYQLRRHLSQCIGIFSTRINAQTLLSQEVSTWLDAVSTIFKSNASVLEAETIDDGERRRLLDELGKTFDRYRGHVYEHGFSAGPERPLKDIVGLFKTALPYLDHAISANRRSDGLYHAYNLVHLDEEKPRATVSHLYEMLEGQVSVLSCGVLDAKQSLAVLDALFDSRMYRADQHSFMLYPDRKLPGFLEKNIIPNNLVDDNPLLKALLEEAPKTAPEERIVEKDADGAYRFAARFKNAEGLDEALEALGKIPDWSSQVAQHKKDALDAWESVFHHHAFTGRSGTMYGYEGLGCIYWHMVSKLLLATQETLQSAMVQGAEPETIAALTRRYADVRAGLGPAKTADVYGAFPTDPYSHSPKHAGAQQPGMTGQVKEEIRTRFAELGVQIERGTLSFGPGLLTRGDFLSTQTTVSLPSCAPATPTVDLPPDTLLFTLAEVPVIYHLDDGPAQITVTDAKGETQTIEGMTLDAARSRSIFLRDGSVIRVDVTISPESLGEVVLG